MTSESTADRQLRELWELVDELGDLSERLRRAADAAVTALHVPPEPEEHHDT